MKMKSGKFYLKNDNITPIEYDKEMDYYKFVKKYNNLGYYQVILPSDVMIEILKYYFCDRKFKIVSVELLEEDDDLSSEINFLIDQIGNDRDFFVDLVERLNFLKSNSSVEIKKIELSSYKNNESTLLYFQVNGVFGIDNDSYEKEIQYLSEIVERNI